MATDTYFYGLGRRKSASASVRLLPGKGTITINGKAAAEYLDGNKTQEIRSAFCPQARTILQALNRGETNSRKYSVMYRRGIFIVY